MWTSVLHDGQVCETATSDDESASDIELVQPPRKKTAGDSSSDDHPLSSSSSPGSSKMRAYKHTLSYNPAWKNKHP